MLLIRGWQIRGKEWLNMSVVELADCPLHGTIPAPRVLQNQLDLYLESYIVNIERRLITQLHNARAKRSDWLPVFLAAHIFLHTLERDIWRLLY
jgi:hypothetical protein